MAAAWAAIVGSIFCAFQVKTRSSSAVMCAPRCEPKASSTSFRPSPGGGAPAGCTRVSGGCAAACGSKLAASIHVTALAVNRDTISVGVIRWERDLDLASGVGEPAGYGTVLVECTDYEAELPEGY